ncbi:FUSC family protein [Tatumella ptyseos]|uniref:FUSC family protein n=1 Tax=Tatumella ptyseos TaxID=82987 RepID=UPI0023F10059|nr:FUSC family protein [Tatumella ptyseos]
MNLSDEIKHDVRLGLFCLPVMIVISVTGLLSGHVPAASIAASGAMTLAFGANKSWGGSTFVMMLITTLGLILSAWMGSMAGNIVPLYIAGALFYTGLYVMMANIDSSAWWMIQQWAIAYLISGYYADNAVQDLGRAGMIGLGGMIQMIFLALVYQHTHFRMKNLNPRGWLTFLKQNTGLYRHKLHLQWSVLTGVMAMCAVMSTVRFFHMPNGYWAGMTLLLCLRNNYQDTFGRARSRVAGTLLGGATAALLITYYQHPWFLVSAFMVTGFISFTLSYSLISKCYWLYSAFITMTVVFMISGFTAPETGIAAHRVEATLVGGFYAIAAFLITRWVTHRKV